MKLNLYKILSATFTFVAVFGSLSLMAQAGPPGPPLGTNSPIDGGVAVLLIGAAAYGYRELKNKQESVTEAA